MVDSIVIRDRRNGSWAWVNHAVFSDKHLTDADVRVYGALCTLGGCSEIRPSIREIGKRSNLTERGARKCISRLEQVGYLKVERGGGDKPNTYYLMKAARGCLLCRQPLNETTPLNEKAGVNETTATPERKSTRPLNETTPEIDNRTRKGKDKSSSVPSDESLALATLLRDSILRNNPKAKPVPEGKLQKWAKEADKLLRLDKREFAEALQLLEWAQQDQFWLTVILSMDSFREKFDKLTLQRERGKNHGTKPSHDWDAESRRAQETNARRLSGHVAR